VRIDEPYRVDTKWDYEIFANLASEKIYGDL